MGTHRGGGTRGTMEAVQNPSSLASTAESTFPENQVAAGEVAHMTLASQLQWYPWPHVTRKQ